MPNNCLSVLYKHIIQVENKNVRLKVWEGRHKHTIAPPPPPIPSPVQKRTGTPREFKRDVSSNLHHLQEDRHT